MQSLTRKLLLISCIQRRIDRRPLPCSWAMEHFEDAPFTANHESTTNLPAHLLLLKVKNSSFLSATQLFNSFAVPTSELAYRILKPLTKEVFQSSSKLGNFGS